MFKNALVMLALDDRDATVLSALYDGAARLGVRKVTAAHIYAHDPFPELRPEAPTEEADLAARMEEAIAAIRARLPEVDVVGIHASGTPEDELNLIIQGEDIDLLLIGRSPARDGKPGWGPSGRNFLRRISCSAMVIPVGSRLDLSRVVVGFDFSFQSSYALQYAVRVADQVDAVYQFDLSAATSGGLSDEEFQLQIAGHTLQHFEEDVLPLLGDAPRPGLLAVRGTDAAQLLVDLAGSRPIVTGTRGLSRLAVLILGSTAENVAGLSLGPTLIIRKKGESESFGETLVQR